MQFENILVADNMTLLNFLQETEQKYCF